LPPENAGAIFQTTLQHSILKHGALGLSSVKGGEAIPLDLTDSLGWEKMMEWRNPLFGLHTA
jgi:hypothetical protein